MKLFIHKIHERKISRNGNVFIRVEFLDEEKKWYKTDICPDFRNYRKWKPILEAGVGTVIDNVFFRTNGEVDADSDVIIIQKVTRQGRLYDK